MIMLPEVCEPRRALPRPDVLDAVTLAAVLGDPIRAGILRMLRDGAYCVCGLAETLGARENNVTITWPNCAPLGSCAPAATGPMRAGSTTSAMRPPAERLSASSSG
ncbi:MAG TPA: ArsR family transcriptional regulator [Gammaproteobacteria bacterium]|nr:ArsR family transcriptional regulator [Gammaproteobacteria bacterium]